MMRLKDAIASLQLGRKKKPELRTLCTIWSEQADDGPLAVPLPEYPRPQMKRADWTCLNGWWEYGICPAGDPLVQKDHRGPSNAGREKADPAFRGCG